MENNKKRSYTFRKISENSLAALQHAHIERCEQVKKYWEQVKYENKLNCKSCNQEKSLEQFSRSNTHRSLSYLTWKSECQICESKRKKLERDKRAEQNGVEYNIQIVLNDVSKRVKKYHREFDIDLPYLIDLYKKQNGVCSYTGIQMGFRLGSFERLSLDRIDSNKGYTKDNVVWCCWIANNMKQDMKVEEFHKWINDIQTTLNS